MISLIKSKDFFNPSGVARCHIIGCGSVGSAVAEYLARLGLTKISIYDFDKVEAHNLANQMFYQDDIGKQKTEAVENMLLRINPDIKRDLKVFGKYESQRLNGYVFLCVDNIDLRREICEKNKANKSIKGVFDFRTRLVDAQHYFADWSSGDQIENLIATMDFSHEEAHDATPVTACNVEMGVAPTVRVITEMGIVNFMNFVCGRPTTPMMSFDVFDFDMVAA